MQNQRDAKDQTAPLRVLRVDSSSRYQQSATRRLADTLIAALRSRHGPLQVVPRDLAQGVPALSEDWIAASFTAEAERNAQQRTRLTQSDVLVRELQDADIVVIGVPLYNFAIPSALKAWIDMVARAQLTFRYTKDGPRGLLQGKKAYLLMASGGVAVDSATDFATPYMRHVLGFLGIDDIEVIAAQQHNQRGRQAVAGAHAHIPRSLAHGSPVHAA